MNGTESHTLKHGHSRVTYHVANRTFDRLFKENSLKEMLDVVRRKLGLPENALVVLSQVRGGQLIDLEDDDDFDAFHAVTHSVSCVDVKVTVQATAPPITTQTTTPNDEETENSSINYRKRKVAFSENDDPIRSPSIDVDQVLPPSKRRRSNSVSKSKRPEVDQHSCMPSNDDASVRIGHSANSNSSDEDVVMQPSSSSALPPPATSNADTSIIAASDIVPDFHQSSHSPNHSLAAPEAKRKQKKVNKAVESANSGDKEEATSEQSERKKKKGKGKAKAIETSSTEENTVSAETVKVSERKRRRKKPSLDKEVMESELPDQGAVSLSTVERFPQQLADAISKNADGEQKREKGGKKRKKGKKSETDKTDVQPSGAMNSDFHHEEPPVVLSGKAAKDAGPGKKKLTNAKQKAKLTPQNSVADGKKSEQSTEKLSVTEIIRAMIRKNAESLRSGSTSERAPRVDKSTTERSKTQLSRKIQATTAVQAFSESDSDDSIKAMRLAAQQRYIKQGEEQTVPDIDIEEVIRPPSARRLTLDKMMRVDIVGQRKEKGVILEEEGTPTRRRSIMTRLASSDSEMEVDGGEDEDSTKEHEPTRTLSEPPVLLLTSVDKAPDAAYPTISDSSTSSTEPDDDSQGVTPKGETGEVGRPSVDREKDAEELSNSNDHSGTSLPGDDPDPIESIPSPARESSPIQASQGDVHVSLVKGRMKKPRGTASLPTIPARPASRKRGKSISSQPVSVHETAVRESVVKMTRSRTKLAANTPSRKSPSPNVAPEPREREAAEEDTPEPTRTTESLGVTGVLDQTGDVNVPHEAWTALDVSSPTEPESSFMMIDQLRSSPEPEPDSPLFLLSETQPGFPFSQWRDPQSQGANDLVHSPHDSQDEEEVVASVTSKRKRPSAAPTFRSLTQIASQPKIYSSSPLLPPPSAPQPKTVTKKELYGFVANGYGDESESSSESEEEKSHIPKSRQAGKKNL